HRRDHHGVDAVVAGDGDLVAHEAVMAVQHRNIAGEPACALRGATAGGGVGGDARGERRIALVGEAVVILDEIDAAERQCLRQRGEAGGRQPLRLDGDAGERARRRADAGAQAGDAAAGAGEASDDLIRQAEIDKLDIGLQRGIAEQHVEQLPGVVADGGGAEADLDLEPPRPEFTDGADAADDFAAHEFIPHRRQRRLDALLQRNRLRPRLYRRGLTRYAIDRDNPRNQCRPQTRRPYQLSAAVWQAFPCRAFPWRGLARIGAPIFVKLSGRGPWLGTVSSRTSCTRRASRTRSAPSCSPSWRARSPSPPRWGRPTPA